MSEARMLSLLAGRYGEDEWAFFTHVNQGTGGNCGRIADAVAMNLWPSRGLAIHGFEIKVSRTDWKKELSDPGKSAPVQRFCDYWWIVVPDAEIVQAGELPPTWGLLSEKAGKLKVTVDAPKLPAEALTRQFFASLVRAAKGTYQNDAVLRSELRVEFERGRKAAESGFSYKLKSQREEFERLQQTCAAFEQQSGIRISNYMNGNIGDAVKAVLNESGPKKILNELRFNQNAMSVAIEQTESAIAQLEELQKRKDAQDVTTPL